MLTETEFENEVKQVEQDCVLRIFPEFEARHVKGLIMVLELLNLQWYSMSLLGKKQKQDAERLNQMIMSVLFRAMFEFDEFERQIIRAKIMDQSVMVPALKLWMKTKEEIHKKLEASQKS